MFFAVTALPDPDVIRRKAGEILQRPEYQPDAVADASRSFTSLLFRLFALLLKPFQWLHGLTEGLPGYVRWPITLGLTAVLVLLVWHILYTIARANRRPQRLREARTRGKTSRSPAELERLADEASGANDYLEAVRLLFRASIIRLENAERRMNRPGTTNRELLRRYRATSLFTPLCRFVETIDFKWYGGQDCTAEDYENCRAVYQQVVNYAAQVQPPRKASPVGSR